MTYSIYQKGSLVQFRNIEQVFLLMEYSHIDILYVMPDTDFSKNIRREDFASLPEYIDWFSPPQMAYDSQPYCVRMSRRGYGPDYHLVFPAHMECCIPRRRDRGQWTLSDANTLSTTVNYLEKELGFPFLWTAGYNGEEYLRRVHYRMKGKIHPLPVEQIDDFNEVLHGAMDRPVWRKLQENGEPGLSEEDCSNIHIVGLDKNGQYLGAANSVYVGNGGFKKVSAELHDKSLVGFWRYRLLDVSNTSFNGYDLPCPLDVNKSWASTTLLEAARTVGVEFEVLGGYIWEESGRYLERWAKDLWQKRVNLRDAKKYPHEIARENAERTMKLTPNSMVGRFMHEYSKEYFHPDWHLGIVHQAMASQTHTLHRLLRDYGLRPVLVNKDAIYFLSNEPAIPGFNLDPDVLKNFKKIGVAPLTSDIIEAFSQPHIGLNDLEHFIKERMR